MNKEQQNDFLYPGERLDDLQIKGYQIIQSPGRFCFGMDAVLLSAFARVKKGERALDLGCGNRDPADSACSASIPENDFTGLEIQEESARIWLVRSVKLNSLEEKVNIVTGDIKEAASVFGAASFEVITSKSALYDRQSRPYEIRKQRIIYCQA